MSAPDNPTAFPVPPAGIGSHGDISWPEFGMTLRDYAALKALPWCLEQNYAGDWGRDGVDHVPRAVRRAFRVADAVLAERAK